MASPKIDNGSKKTWDSLPEYVHHKLSELIPQSTEPPHYIVAFSGGVDSTVLLHALWHYKQRINTQPHSFKLSAAHIQHNLQAQAEQWQQHCAQFCRNHHISFFSNTLETIAIKKGDSLEAEARKHRYAALETILTTQAMLEMNAPPPLLLTAHQQDDQAETLLIQLFRGAGPQGLSGMPAQKTWGSKSSFSLLRPLLEVPKKEIIRYAQYHKLPWVEDVSNTHTRFTRNFIRHKVLPLLQTRWPNITQSLARSAQHCGNMCSLNAHFLESTYLKFIDNQHRLSAECFINTPILYHAPLLRYWLKKNKIPLPSTSLLKQLLAQIKKQHIQGEKKHSANQQILLQWKRREIGTYCIIYHHPYLSYKQQN